MTRPDSPLDYRYQNDPTWRALVDHLEHAYSRGEFTASDVRTAAIYAMLRHEMRAIRPLVMRFPPDDLNGEPWTGIDGIDEHGNPVRAMKVPR